MSTGRSDLLADIDSVLAAHVATIEDLAEEYFADAMAGVRDAIDGAINAAPYCDALDCTHGLDSDGYPCEATLGRWRPAELDEIVPLGPFRPWESAQAGLRTGLGIQFRFIAIDEVTGVFDLLPLSFGFRVLSEPRMPEINRKPHPPTREPVIPVDLLHEAQHAPVRIDLPEAAWRQMERENEARRRENVPARGAVGGQQGARR